MKAGFTLNGEGVQVEAAPLERLDRILRDHCRIESVRSDCGTGDCGACTVSMNGQAVLACLTPLASAEGAEIWTQEGLSCHPAIQAQRADAVRLKVASKACGHCLPALAMTSLTETVSRESLTGIACECAIWDLWIATWSDLEDGEARGG